MKFLYSDTQDYVDPDYDFIADRNSPTRERYWTDVYAHEILDPAPYDGLLVSMSAVRKAASIAASKVRYSTKEEQRLLREGARKFLRFDGPKFSKSMLMGDCGAFAYADRPTPAYEPDEVVEFYTDAGFSHGVSPDHIIFDCDTTNPPVTAINAQTQDRFDITLANAEIFLRLVTQEQAPFEPMGAVQGWSPASMADSAHALEKMGYRYLAIGGLVPLRVQTIKEVLQAIRSKIKPSTKIHLLGFAKAENIDEFTNFGITSFDSTSPLIRAFKDEKANYYSEGSGGKLDYFTAIRIPQAMENTRLMQGVKRGIFNAEDLYKREQRALSCLRKFDVAKESLDVTLESIIDYHQFLIRGDGSSVPQQEKSLKKTRDLIQRTLEARPWKTCTCHICKTIGVEVIIFRSSNRNKRRGFHNLSVYHNHLKKTLERTR